MVEQHAAADGPIGRPSGGAAVAPIKLGGRPALAAWPSGRRRRRPLVVVAHGLLGDPHVVADWLLELALGGCVALALRAAYAEGEPGLRARLADRFLETLNETVLQTARATAEALAALDGWRGADGSRAALVGISAGGFAVLRAALDCPAAAVATVCSGPGWLEPPAELGPEIEGELGLRPRDLRPKAPFDPERYPGVHGRFVLDRAQKLAGRAVLLCVGGRDPVAPAEPARLLHRELAARDPEGAERGRLQLLVYPALGHRVTGPMRHRVASWVRWMLDG